MIVTASHPLHEPAPARDNDGGSWRVQLVRRPENRAREVVEPDSRGERRVDEPGMAREGITHLRALSSGRRAMVHHATFTVRAAVTSRRRKPAKRATPMTAPGWLAVMLIVAVACMIGAVVL